MKTNNLLLTAATPALALAANRGARIFGAEAIARHVDQRSWKNHRMLASGSIATGNRHGGPHLHRREIARRQRQAAR